MTKNLRFVSSMFFAFLLGCSVVNVGGNAEDYLPMEAGNTWVYEVRSSGNVDTFTYTITETNPGIYKWSQPLNENTVLCADISDGSDPFNDSVVVVVDSALLLWTKANLAIPFDPEKIEQQSVGNLVTEYGNYENCIFISGSPTEAGNIGYRAWLAYNIGPVRVEKWEGNILTREFLLLDFYSVK